MQLRQDGDQKVMPLLLSGDHQLSDAPRTAKAAMLRAMANSCPSTAPPLLNSLFSGDESVEQYANGIEKPRQVYASAILVLHGI